VKTFILSAAALACAASAHAQIVVDGTLDSAVYGAELWAQDTATQFGNASDGLVGQCNGSEVNNLHAVLDVQGGFLYLFIGGNLESNFNKFELFIDCAPGGQNTVRADNPDVDFNGLNRMGVDATNPGLTFDAGFEADFYVTTTNGGGPITCYANIAQMLTEGGGSGGYIGSAEPGFPIVSQEGVEIATNNSNTAGVPAYDGTTTTGSGSGCGTGIEVKLPLNIIGYPGKGDIKVMAMVNGGGHDYLSNQFTGGCNGCPNLAEPRLVNFEAIPGLQYVTVSAGGGGGNPCPADLDGDGEVGGADLGGLLAGWGGSSPDLDGDGSVGGSDLGAMLAAWGPCQP
jgi:hypothetical protein